MQRISYQEKIDYLFTVFPIIALLGPRQCGKTTLAKDYFRRYHGVAHNYFDLENPIDLARLAQPKLALENLNGLIVIDEIQRAPDLFPILRVIVDQKKPGQRFLILGSASKHLIRQASESLAGRIDYIEMTPFQIHEVCEIKKLWLRGGFPLSYLADDELKSFIWRKAYIKTFLEQDIPALGIQIPANQLSRFWQMIAHYQGGIFNASEIGNSLQLNHKTVRNYLDILVGTFMIRELQPWHENISKRQVKSPKIYIRDSGIFHGLMGLADESHIQTHPKLGISWEAFVLEQVINFHNALPSECFFWNTYAQAELDLLIVKDNQKQGFEIKYQDAPRMTKSMRMALKDLKLDKLIVLYPGEVDYQLHERIHVVSAKNYFLKNDDW